MRVNANQAAILMRLVEALSRLAGQHPLLQLEITEPMARLLGVDFIGTAFWNFRNSSYEDAYCYGRDPEMAQLYERHFQFLDPIGARQNRLNARAKHIYEDVAYSELKKSEYFNDFLVRFGTTEGINASLFEGDRYLTDIRFWRGPSRMLLGPDECGMVELLRPYLEKAIVQHCHHKSAAAANRHRAKDHIPVELTPREASIAELLCSGLSDKELAAKMGISFWTVRTHLAKMLEKAGAKNRTQLALLLRRENANWRVQG